ncbi:hypothetical protein NLX83_27875 [Allokutzneria sp. A3M-2-11 16]|nr:hypothetical protein [Allokutzneria sp. A3M-2-11 16]MCP3803101.1 hypothetical protein [Allokutzneria sp. A3M-2-11 16]
MIGQELTEGHYMLSTDQVRALLREHDDPDFRNLERPADFDRDASRDCFA